MRANLVAQSVDEQRRIVGLRTTLGVDEEVDMMVGRLDRHVELVRQEADVPELVQRRGIVVHLRQLFGSLILFLEVRTKTKTLVLI